MPNGKAWFLALPVINHLILHLTSQCLGKSGRLFKIKYLGLCEIQGRAGQWTTYSLTLCHVLAFIQNGQQKQTCGVAKQISDCRGRRGEKWN